jgi:hypothetical protein
MSWRVYFAKRMPHYMENRIGWDLVRDHPMTARASERIDAHLRIAYPSLEAQNG